MTNLDHVQYMEVHFFRACVFS